MQIQGFFSDTFCQTFINTGREKKIKDSYVVWPSKYREWKYPRGKPSIQDILIWNIKNITNITKLLPAVMYCLCAERQLNS